MSTITRGIVIEDSGATLLDRITNSAGSTSIAAGDFSAITVRAIDMDSDAVVKTTSIAPSAAVQTLAVADGWTADRVGRNVSLVPRWQVTVMHVFADAPKEEVGHERARLVHVRLGSDQLPSSAEHVIHGGPPPEVAAVSHPPANLAKREAIAIGEPFADVT